MSASLFAAVIFRFFAFGAAWHTSRCWEDLHQAGMILARKPGTVSVDPSVGDTVLTLSTKYGPNPGSLSSSTYSEIELALVLWIAVTLVLWFSAVPLGRWMTWGFHRNPGA